MNLELSAQQSPNVRIPKGFYYLGIKDNKPLYADENKTYILNQGILIDYNKSRLRKMERQIFRCSGKLQRRCSGKLQRRCSGKHQATPTK